MGDWDGAAAITVDGVVGRLVHDVSGRDHHALVVNGPTRAVTGVRWDSTVHDYRWAPDQYAAIHFHDDDLASADWHTTIDLEVAGDTPSGVYAGRLRTDDSEHYVVFYVRPPRGAEAQVALLMPTYSYRAYANDHCAFDVPFAQMIIGHTPVLQASDVELDRHREFGLSLYDTHRDGSGVSLSSRARPILNLAPGSSYWLSPSVWQFNADLHLVDWLTERGPRFDVLTDADLHDEGVAALAPYRVILTGSHPEYATAAMLDALEEFLDGGGRLMYLGANGFYWVTGVDPEDPDVIEVRRWGGSQAWRAQPGEFHLATTGELGGLWRNRGRPPQQLVGVGFASEGLDRSSPYRRLVADGERGSWVFDGTGVDEGALFGDRGLVGGGAAGLELDIIDEELGTPADAVVLATSGEHSDAYFEVVEELYFNARGFSGPSDPRVRADLTLVSLPSGGAVYSAGSIAWCGALSERCLRQPGLQADEQRDRAFPRPGLRRAVRGRSCLLGRELIGHARSRRTERRGHRQPPVQPRRSRLERPTCVEEVGVGESPPDELHTDWKAVLGPAGRKRRRRVASHVEREGERNPLQWIDDLSGDLLRPLCEKTKGWDRHSRCDE